MFIRVHPWLIFWIVSFETGFDTVLGVRLIFQERQTLDIRPYEPSMHDAWEALVEASPQAWLFHKRVYIEAVNRSMQVREHSLTLWKNNHLVAIFPLNLYPPEQPPKLNSYSPSPAGMALQPGLGAKEAKEITQALHDAALEVARRENCKALILSLPPLAPTQLANAHGVSPLDPLGYAAVSTSTYIINLETDEETLFHNLRELARRQIRKAREAGVTIRPANENDLGGYYDLHCATYDRTGVHPHPKEYFSAIFQQMAPAGLARIWAAEHQGKTIGYLNTAHYKSGAFYWTGCSSDAALELGANYLLQWHAILDAKARGMRWYDSGEAFPGEKTGKHAGLDSFKSGFGGERWPFHRGRIDLQSSNKKPSKLRLSLYYVKEALKVWTR